MSFVELIAKHPKIFEPYPGNPGLVNWSGIPQGWIPIIDDLCSCIQHYIDTTVQYIEGTPVKCSQVTCTQMKEKFGELRFYYQGGNEVIEGMVEMATFLCSHTCELCGARTEGAKSYNGWINVYCKNCER